MRTLLKKYKFGFLKSFIMIIPTYTYSVKCTQTLLNLHSKGPYSSSEREIKFRCCLITFSIKHDISHLLVIVVQTRAEMYKKVVVLLIKPIVFFLTSSLPSALLDLKVPSNICKAALWSFLWAPNDSMNYQKCVLKFPSTCLANRQWLFQQANHGAYSNPGTQWGSRTRISVLFHRQT